MNTTHDIVTSTHLTVDTWNFIWHGSHTINIFRWGTEVDCFSYYDKTGNPPDLAKVKELVTEYLNEDSGW